MAKKEQSELFVGGWDAGKVSHTVSRGGSVECLITPRAKNRWRHHRLPQSLSVGWRNVRACPVWLPLPSARVLFESGSAVTLNLSERSDRTKLHPLANIDFKLDDKLEYGNCSSQCRFWGVPCGWLFVYIRYFPSSYSSYKWRTRKKVCSIYVVIDPYWKSFML